ncbi:MAG: AzlD domain-containing protein, partial [Alphaproteobacteria bacterium]
DLPSAVARWDLTMPAIDFSQLEAWAAVGLAFLGTFIWRFLGVMLADKVQPDSMLMKWVNAVAYAMVAGVMMLVLVFPTGVLETTELSDRLIAFAVGVIVMFFTHQLWYALPASIITFAIVVGLF